MNFCETDEKFTIKVDGKIVKQVKSYKYRGSIQDEKLNLYSIIMLSQLQNYLINKPTCLEIFLVLL